MARDPELEAHKEWLGYVQPVGLVVSPPALHACGAQVNKNIIPDHQRFLNHIRQVSLDGSLDTVAVIADFPAFVTDVFGWQHSDLVSDGALESLEVVLQEYGETLRPTYAVREAEPGDEAASPWLMLIQEAPMGADLDEVPEMDNHRWEASPHARFERLLRENNIPIGLLFNGASIRMIYAPRGETSGYMTFKVSEMAQVSGRPMFAGLHMLLAADRMFTLPRKERLASLLSESRKYQNLVSTQLSGQVLNSLYELLRGFQAADDAARGELLRQVLREEPNHVYAGLLNVLMRLIFVLYAEDRGMMPGDSTYVNHYSVSGLFERLRAEAGRFSDTMDLRYGAWGQLLALFRLVHDGGGHGSFRLPPRHGHLFNPDRYPFLEGRPWQSLRMKAERTQPPMVSDGVVFRVLQDLLILDGERLSYRTLDVEQIGSVYETIMGFTLEVAKGRSIAVKPTKPHGAPLTINLDELLEVKSGNRAKWVKDAADQAITGESLRALQEAATPEDLVAALGKKVSPTTPRIVPPEAMILQPSDERRRSGSHYTPRSLTEPIVRTTLRPVLEQLGDKPTPDQILDLKVCDPAMGSGAFLVEADRQLADELVKAWHNHNCVPAIPPDEDEVLFARRLVVQRCLYGVDKNPLAVDLAKLALWLATLAKDHAFTFVDHSLKCGDSLVGLSRQQIAAFHWQPTKYVGEIEHLINERIQQAMELRASIQNADETVNETTLRLMLKESQEALDIVRTIGDLAVAAFFSSEKPKERENKRGEYLTELTHALTIWSAPAERSGDGALDSIAHESIQSGGAAAALQNSARWSAPIKPGIESPEPGLGMANLDVETAKRYAPFHWQVEFPEVFTRENPGFDAFVGNPPFAGVVQAATSLGENYTGYLRTIFPPASGKTDLVAFFFRRAYDLVRDKGTLGLVATNTIGQGDTRESGLAHICDNGGQVFDVRKRIRWPGTANVIVATAAITKGDSDVQRRINGKCVSVISAFLFHAGGNHNPQKLLSCPAVASKGVVPYGMGFVFEDGEADCTPAALAENLLLSNANNAMCLRRFLGGEDLNSHPRLTPARYIIDFGSRTEEEARQWPDLLRIVEEKVKPTRHALTTQSGATTLKRYWWQFAYQAKELMVAKQSLERVVATSQTGKYRIFAFLPSDWVFDQKVVVLANDRWCFFASIQSRPHEIWSLFFGSTMKDDPVYTPSDCFETFPFPKGFETNPALESAGKEYYEFRAALMVRNNEGLTKTYNRFHNPEERSPDILRLRELHAAMDRAVLDAYNWTDLQPTCEFLLDYEEDEEDDEAAPGRGRGNGRGHGSRVRKKPWRYRWPDDFRDEVLARLLELNRSYAEQERLSGAAAEKKGKRAGGKSRIKAEADDEEGIGQQDLDL